MLLHRRHFLLGVGAVAGTTAGRIVGADAPLERDGHTPITRSELEGLMGRMGQGHLTCVRTLEAVEGPFYYESSPERRAIAEDRQGVPLRLGITIVNTTMAGIAPGSQCAPLSGAIVDVWQADAEGLYSNVGADLQVADTTGRKFLRGHYVSDEQGYVEFESIVPGWELVAGPRTTHIHVKVFQERKVVTTQLYFPDAFLDQLYASVDPYQQHRKMTSPLLSGLHDRIHNGDDALFRYDQSRPMHIQRLKNGVVFARATIGITSMGAQGFAPLFR